MRGKESEYVKLQECQDEDFDFTVETGVIDCNFDTPFSIYPDFDNHSDYYFEWSTGNFKRFLENISPGNKTKIDILIEGGNPNNPADWIEQTWHHHENGIDLMPIPTKIHQTALHSGGKSTKYGTKIGDPDLSNLFQYEVEYK